MRVTVEVDDETGEVRVTTVGYRGQDPSIVVPLLTTSTTSALQRLQARRQQLAPAAAAPLAAAVVGALAQADPIPARPTPAERPVLALAPPLLDDQAEHVDRGTVDDVVVAPAPPDRRAPTTPAPRLDVRAEALRMLDDGVDAFVIVDELDVTAGQLRQWARNRGGAR